MLRITDIPGVISALKIRECFEKAVSETDLLRSHFDTGNYLVDEAGNFSEYLDEKTHTAWVGFAIGMRCSERYVKRYKNDQKSIEPKDI